MTFGELTDLVLRGGAGVVLLGVVVAFIKRILLTSWHHEEVTKILKESLAEMKRDRDEWRELALNGQGINARAVEVADKAVGRS